MTGMMIFCMVMKHVNIDYDSLICVDENDTADLPINERLATLLKMNWVSERSSDTLKKICSKNTNHQKIWKSKFPK